ncbi:hypothetical protein BSKO_04604 [Bryopsis sp. KO-2023]|nr:hypothetical protein BSKO_04604 [Bryopsis sp. KO-2023]
MADTVPFVPVSEKQQNGGDGVKTSIDGRLGGAAPEANAEAPANAEQHIEGTCGGAQAVEIGSESTRAGDIIQDGAKVCIFSNGDRYSFATVAKGRQVRLNNKLIELGSLLGHPFGSSFQIDGRQFLRLGSSVQGDIASNISEGRNNSRIIDDNTSQKLSYADIKAMQEQGKGGEQIVDALVANSSTFSTKTEFSQEKYKAKKAKKYSPFCMALKPTAATVCEAQFSINPEDICHLRADALAIMLNLANVSANKRVLVVESCMGLVTGAVAERMGLLGLVVYAYMGCQSPDLDVFKKFQLNRKHNVVRIPLLELKELVGSVNVDDILAKQKSEEGACVEESTGQVGEGEPNNERPAMKHREENKDYVIPPADPQALKPLLEGGFDSCLLIAPRFHPTSLIDYALPMLAPGAPFVIYSPHMGPMTECHSSLSERKVAGLLELQETWWREYQVLPERTHPMMDGKNAGGFILSGYKVIHEKMPENLLAARKQSTRPNYSKKSWKKRR